MATLQARDLRARGGGVQPELAAAAAGDPVRQARSCRRGRRPRRVSSPPTPSVLEKLRDAHPIVDAILSWRELDKLNSTYLDALPKQVDPRDGRVHTTFNQTGAATGRLSSTNPNLQNIPVRGELGRQIRRAFVPGSKGDVLLVADYSQIELRVLAHLSGDEGLAEAFESGADIHTATSARVFGLPEDQVDPATRSRAKVINYGLAYGMNAFGLAVAAGDRAGRGAGVHRRVLRGVPADPRVPRPAGRRGRRPRGSPRRCSGAADTSPSSRPRTRASATWAGAWR